MKFFLVFVFLSFGIVLHAQDRTYDEDIKYFIELNGTMGQYRDGTSQLLTMLKEQYKDANVSESVWKEIEGVAQFSLEGLKIDLITVYKKFFTHNEIIELNNLYKKEVAQKFINNVMAITDASQDASIVWSRSLYNQLTDLLHEKGYNTTNKI